MIVVDASVAVKWFVVEDRDQPARRLLGQHDPLIGPDFVIYETLNVLRRKHKRAEIDAVQVQRAAGDLISFFDQLVPAATLIAQTIDLSALMDHAIYDCAYLACAIQHQASLITADEVFVRKATACGFQAIVTLLR